MSATCLIDSFLRNVREERSGNLLLALPSRCRCLLSVRSELCECVVVFFVLMLSRRRGKSPRRRSLPYSSFPCCWWSPSLKKAPRTRCLGGSALTLWGAWRHINHRRHCYSFFTCCRSPFFFLYFTTTSLVVWVGPALCFLFVCLFTSILHGEGAPQGGQEGDQTSRLGTKSTRQTLKRLQFRYRFCCPRLFLFYLDVKLKLPFFAVTQPGSEEGSWEERKEVSFCSFCKGSQKITKLG